MIIRLRDFGHLRDAFAARSGSASPAEHPFTEDIHAAATSAPQLDQARRLEIIDHVGRCAPCAEAWRLALALDQDSGKVAHMRSSVRQVTVAALALAASLVLAVGIWLQGEEAGIGEPPDYRAPAETAMQSQTGAGLPRHDFELRWTPHPLADSYTVQVTDATLTPLFRQEGLAEPRLRIPAKALSGLDAGQEVLWRVEAQLEAGGTFASETFTTTVR
jgi:hypothetical protein